MLLKEDIIKWNRTWHFDFWYRQKYNIAFNSEQHRALCQIDIKMDYLEKKLAEQEYERYETNKKNEEELKKNPHMWLKPRVNTEIDEKLWDMIDLSKLK